MAESNIAPSVTAPPSDDKGTNNSLEAPPLPPKSKAETEPVRASYYYSLSFRRPLKPKDVTPRPGTPRFGETQNK